MTSQSSLDHKPIALAMPAKPYPFFFDASTTVVTRGKLEMYRKAEKELPQGWALDKDGNPSCDAPDVLDNIANKIGGGIMPLGGSTEQLGSHKGYGYGMFCEIFCSISSGFPKIFGSIAIKPWQVPPTPSICVWLDVKPCDKIEAVKDRMENGIDVDVKTVLEMKDLSNYVGVDFEKYFGKLDIEDDGYKTVY